MSSVVDDAAVWLKTLTPIDRARFFAALSHRLTVAGRVLAHSAEADAVRLEQLRQLNEIQHRVSSYISHALGSDEDPGWLRVVASFVHEPQDSELRRHAAYTWAEARKWFQAVT